MKKSYFLALSFLGLIICSVICIQGCRDRHAPSETVNTGGSGFGFKERLSDYGFFADSLRDLHPAKGVVSYELITPLFTDYSVKDRFYVLPAGKQVRYTPTGVLDFPDSTIIIKNFAYRNTEHRKIMIETRLLVKDPSDKAWKVMDYLWNDAQTDAVKHITGAKLPITLLDDDGMKISTVYQVPNTNDCKRCHYNGSELSPIGPKARNLNFVRNGQTANQLTQWAAAGSLSGLPALTEVPQLPDWKDSKHYTLDQRARAYLDVNCAHCHTKGGDAYNTGLFLEYQQTDPFHIGIRKAPVSAGGGAGGLNFDIIPGDAVHSILAFRMNSTEPGTAMPELARTVIHKEAVKLIVEWINKMPKQKS